MDGGIEVSEENLGRVIKLIVMMKPGITNKGNGDNALEGG